MSAAGPKRQFVAVQRYGRCRWNTGRSVDVADTVAPDPQPTSGGVAGRRMALLPADVLLPIRYSRRQIEVLRG
jgi:hypothetical protein